MFIDTKGNKIDTREFLENLFLSAVNVAKPANCLPNFLPSPPKGKTIVIGAGKAAGAMAATVEKHWPTSLQGLVITRYGHSYPTKYIKVIEAGHPIPDMSGKKASMKIMRLLDSINSEDLVICLISGGGSALLTLPADGVSLDNKKLVTDSLLRSGATISEINCVRKHLSAIKGGKLAIASHPACLVTLAISDVPGDDPSVIASGPTVPDATTFKDAQKILENYNISKPREIIDFIKCGKEETPKSGDVRLIKTSYHTIAKPSLSLDAAATFARHHGLKPIVLGDALEGEARKLGSDHALLALKEKKNTILLSGGETTVTVSGPGRGGRNAEYALGVAETLNGNRNIYCIACDTDGIDGTEDNAGVIVTPDTLKRAKLAGISLKQHQETNDSYGFFKALDDLIITGPTLTNVNDFRAILISPDIKL